MMYTTPIMFKKDDKFQMIPESIPMPPVMTEFDQVRDYYKKTFGYRMTRKLSHNRLKKLFENAVVEYKSIHFKRGGTIDSWTIPCLKRKQKTSFVSVVAEALGKTVIG